MLRPFENTAQSACGAMMTSIHYGDATQPPAVLSPRMMQKARQIYPDGLLITDDLWADGLRQWGKPPEADEDTALLTVTRAAILAGNDILMITYPQKTILMKQAITQWIKEDETVRQQVDQAVARILKLKFQ